MEREILFIRVECPDPVKVAKKIKNLLSRFRPNRLIGTVQVVATRKCVEDLLNRYFVYKRVEGFNSDNVYKVFGFINVELEDAFYITI